MRKRPLAQINVVPYIDVMLVLLVIFMVTASNLPTSVVELPSVGAHSASPQKEPVIVTLDQKGGITLEKESVDETALIEKLLLIQKKDPNRPVVIAADQKLAYGEVVSLMTSLRENGIERIGLLANVKK